MPIRSAVLGVVVGLPTLDPGCAPALVGMADCEILSAFYDGAEASGAARRATAYVEHALSLDTDLAAAHCTRGFINLAQLQFANAERELREAIRLDDSNAIAFQWYADFLASQGRLRDAVQFGHLALARAPHCGSAADTRSDSGGRGVPGAAARSRNGIGRALIGGIAYRQRHIHLPGRVRLSPRMNTAPIPVAIIGLGAVADSHIAAYRTLPEVKIVAVVDPREERTRSVAAELDVPGFTDCAQMLKNVRPAIGCVLSTVASHRPITEMLAAAGVHVLCEKPIANSLDDALAMARACERYSVEFMYGSSYRFLPAVIKARELIASGAIGKPRLVEERGVVGSGAENFTPMSSAHYPQGTPGGGGFGLVDHGVHLLDIFPWLLDSPIRRVLGRGNYSGGPMEPEFAIAEHDCGAISTLTYDESTVSSDLPWEGVFSHGHNWKRGLGFAGDTGEWTPGASFLRVHGTHGALRIFHYANRLFLCLPGSVREIDVPEGAAPEHFGRQLRGFVDALKHGQPTPLGAAVGIHALKVLLAVYRSAKTDSWAAVE